MSVGGDRVELRLLDGFACSIAGTEVALAEYPAELVIQVFLGGGRASRRSLQQRMWPDVTAENSAKRLRQLLWRVGTATGGRLLEAGAMTVTLAEGVTVDVGEAEALARSLSRISPAGLPDGWEVLSRPLLPGWDSDEVTGARERWDQLRLLALQDLAAGLLRAGDVAAAIEIASRAQAIDALSEGSHRVLAAAHLARADRPRAERAYRAYARLLHTELGVPPSQEFQRLLDPA
ncbi:bacterial transcriptional activator domain-containing protein [Actinocorallia longicatena]